MTTEHEKTYKQNEKRNKQNTELQTENLFEKNEKRIM